MDSAFPLVRQAIRSAFEAVRRPHQSAEVGLYNKLKPSDFKELSMKYGEEKVLSYIKDMEQRRIPHAG